MKNTDNVTKPKPVDIQFNKETYELLHPISKWAKFLAIVGFTFWALMLISTLSSMIMRTAGSHAFIIGTYEHSPMALSWMYLVSYMIIIIIYFFPILYLYNFASRTQKALTLHDPAILHESFLFLKKYFMIIGIFTIIGLTFLIVSTIAILMRLA